MMKDRVFFIRVTRDQNYIASQPKMDFILSTL